MRALRGPLNVIAGGYAAAGCFEENMMNQMSFPPRYTRQIAVRMLAVMFACMTVAIPVAAGATGPYPPCGTAPDPSFPPAGLSPRIATWNANDLRQSNWQPPACTGWPVSSASKLIVAVVGSVRVEGTIDQLLARIAAISKARDIQYWSTTDKSWRPLAYDASALTGPSAKDRRPDFSVAELGKGAQLYYWENDSRSGEIIYRLSVRERSPERAVIASENLTPVRRFLITLFPPGTLQSVIFIQHLSSHSWGVYILSRIDSEASMLAEGHEASYINRAVALYRQIAGIRTNAEPPAAR